MRTYSRKIYCAVFLALVALVIYALNCFTSMYLDDWVYAFKYGTHDRVEGISDIITGQWLHYLVKNGRYPVHFIVQLFDGILGKGVFNVFNTVVFVLFLYVLVLVTTHDRKNYFKSFSIAFILVFLVIIGFKDAFLWMSGSVNYLWASTAILFFHYFLEKKDNPKWAYVLLAILGFFCGWSNEVFVVGLGAAYFIYFVTHRKQLKGHRLLMLCAFYLGTILLVFSPGTIHRALYENTLMRYSLFLKFVHMYNVALFYVLILLIAYKAIFKRHNFWAWVKQEQLLLIAVAVSFVFVCMSGAWPDRTRFGIDLFSLMIIMRSINWDRIGTRLIAVADVIVLLFAGYIAHNCYLYHQSVEDEMAQIRDGKTLIATTQPDILPFAHRYALEYSEYDTNYDFKMYGMPLEWIPTYFGADSLLFLPKAFLDDVKANPEQYDKAFRSFGTLPFYAKRYPNADKVDYCSLVYEKPVYDSWPTTLHPLLMRITGQPQEVVPIGSMTVEIAGEKYILVHRTWPDQDKRLKSIRLE